MSKSYIVGAVANAVDNGELGLIMEELGYIHNEKVKEEIPMEHVVKIKNNQDEEIMKEILEEIANKHYQLPRMEPFNREKSKIKVRGVNNIKFDPYPTEVVSKDELYLSEPDLISVRNYVFCFTSLLAMQRRATTEVSGQRIFEIGSKGLATQYYGSSNEVFNNCSGIDANNRNSMRNIAGSTKKDCLCTCSFEKGVCPHFKTFKPTIVIMVHSEVRVSEATIKEILSLGIPIVYVTHTFSHLTKKGSYGIGRWTECTWNRYKGKVFFEIVGKRAYYHSEYFNYMAFTHSKIGEYYGINKAIDVSYGSFSHVGLILNPLKRTPISIELLNDFRMEYNYAELFKFRYENFKVPAQVSIMDKELTLTEAAGAIQKDGDLCFIPEAEKKEEGTLVKNFSGVIHFAPFKNSDYSLMKSILGWQSITYSNSFISEYFGYHKFESMPQSFTISLEKYNELVAKIVLDDIDNDSLLYHVSTCLRSTFKWTSDPVLPILLLKSVMTDVTRIKSAVKGLMTSKTMQLLKDVEKSNFKPGPINDILFSMGNSQVDPKKYENLNGFPTDMKEAVIVPAPKGTTYARPKIQELHQELMKTNVDRCTAITLLCLWLEYAETPDEEIPSAEDAFDYMEQLVEEIKELNPELAYGMARAIKGVQPTITEFHKIAEILYPDLHWIGLYDDEEPELNGSEGPTIVYSRNHVQLAENILYGLPLTSIEDL